MQPGRGPGVVLGLSPFVQKFYKPPHLLQQQASTASDAGGVTGESQVQAAAAGNGSATTQ